MNKVKDFIYDKNDLLVAFIIVAVAAFVIMMRVDIIMAYPLTITLDENPSDHVAVVSPNRPEIPQYEDPAGTSDPDAEQENENPPTVAQPPANSNVGRVSIYIEYGSTGSQIAQLLIDAGLIDSKEDFYNAVTEAGADTKLQAGSFKIPSNATLPEIVRIITN